MSAGTGVLGRETPSESRGRTQSYGYFLAFLLVIGCVTDIQGVALLPLLGEMSSELGLTGSQVGWALNALNIASAVLLGLSARYADIVGHRRVLLPLLLLGVVGGALCALATGFEMLLVGRLLLGMAIAAPMAWAMVKVRATDTQLEKAALLNGAVIAVMTPIALVMGGVLLKLGAAWNSVFWIIAAGYALMLAMAYFAPETPVTQRTRTRLDIVGAVLLGAWLVCVLVALSNGQSWGWSSPKFLIWLGTGLVLLIGWLLQQRATPHAILDFRGMEKRQVAAGYLVYSCVAMLATGLYILLPGLAQTPSAVGYGLDNSVLKSSLALMPILPGTLIASWIASRALPKFGPRPILAVAGLMCAAAYVWYAFAHDAYWQLLVGTSVYGVGIVLAFNVGWALTAAAGRQDNMSITFGIQYALALPAAALMTALIFAIQSSHLIAGLPVPTEGSYQANFLILAALALFGIGVISTVLAPRRLGFYTEPTAPIVVPAEVETSISPGIATLPGDHR